MSEWCFDCGKRYSGSLCDKHAAVDELIAIAKICLKDMDTHSHLSIMTINRLKAALAKAEPRERGE